MINQSLPLSTMFNINEVDDYYLRSNLHSLPEDSPVLKQGNIEQYQGLNLADAPKPSTAQETQTRLPPGPASLGFYS